MLRAIAREHLESVPAKILMKNRPLVLTSMALAALALGSLVYMLDRPIGSARLMPYYLQFSYSGSVGFGWISAQLPSFLHIYAFVLLTAAALRPSYRTLLIICAFWFCIEGIFEMQQHPAIHHLLSTSGIPMAWAGRGVFDPLDVAALAAGVVTALLTVLFANRRTE